jgi:hypothetical protein
MRHNATDLGHSTEQQERITIAFLALSWLFILLRIWTRTCVISNFGWDDTVMILAGVRSTLSSTTGPFKLTSSDDIHHILRSYFIRRIE